MDLAGRIVANLDVESAWQRLLLPRRPVPALGRGVLDLVSGFGTLLRAFAESDRTELWTPRPVDPSRLVGPLPRPTLRSGTTPHGDLLAWGRVDETAAYVNHRRFGFDLSRQLGVALDGAAWITDEPGLLSAVRDLDAWVAKAPLSAAGRDRVIGRGAPDELARRQLANLLARGDGLLVEPWLPRIADHGVLLEVDAEDAHVVSMHRQLVHEAGRFAGIELEPPDADTHAELRAVALEVGVALRAAGYSGPVALDAWSWRATDGSVRLQPLGEINARLSFGWVAGQIRDRLGLESLRLRLGQAADLAAAGDSAVPVLLPDEAGRGAAWIESL